MANVIFLTKKIKQIMSLKNYVKLTRINQPIGILLLFLPCLFGISLAIKRLANPNLNYVAGMTLLFFIGSILMRSAGCIINDILDKKFDEKIFRTKNRPLAANNLSQKQALNLLAFLLFLSSLVLLQFNFITILSGFFALVLVITYPLMKRFTYYPQIFLGLTFNFGILMASFAILENIDLDFLILYFSAIIWTVIYDTIYAFQDIEDDLRIGVKSTAIKFSKNPKKILILLNLLMFLSLFYLGVINNFHSGFFLLILLACLFLLKKIVKCDFTNSKKCLAAFKANFLVGILILTALILG